MALTRDRAVVSVCENCDLEVLTPSFRVKGVTYFFCIDQDLSKIEAFMKEDEESTDLIPKLEDNIPKLQKLLLDEEKILD
ncbi:structural maintenance of chromosome 4 [Vigna unguiculata]|uniref:Structural maintenance of chromosome 4 n=1 Tax=Vigna unguiculata TaxID=3917 RepID=A0A4D6KXI4_VIGUN|nr:structural maintenance of chromosome 4 [Vigna unguiculata]